MSKRTINETGRDEQRINEGGPAFPAPHYGSMQGMTLRDWFAGQALAGMMSIRDIVENYGETRIADMAYQQADAMLRVRRA